MSNFIDKNKLNKDREIEKITLSLATKDDVLQWSNGEVTKPETINYKSYKPERDGLFDELIFGPTTDHKCPVCGTKYKRSDEGTQCSKTPLCEKSKATILAKISRRSRMGHIHLQNPVVHFWFFKIDHSIISKLLGLRVAKSSKTVSKTDLEKLIYYKSHIVLESGGIKALQKNAIIDIAEAAVIYRDALLEIRSKYSEESEEYEIINESLEELESYATSKMGKDYGIDFYEYNEIIHEYSDAIISTGSKAIEYLLEHVDLQKEAQLIEDEIKKINRSIKDKNHTGTRGQERSKLYKRLAVINAFINSGQDPKSMLIYDLPVIPADLRPLVQLDGGRHSTSDINELYRRIIIRNNRLKKWEETDAPMLIKQNEYRMIQEAVDSLIDNARKKPNPVTSKDSRPLKSISDALTGKKGRFRQNLLGKRVDYSGRSVIVVGPELKMHQVGIPREMAAKLFEPWIIKELIKGDNQINSIKAGKKAVENLDPIIWPYVEKAIQGRPVLLNRAPTLHRLSIQAYEPVLIRGKAIKLHPLSCTPFNADFDGDQMAVHVPISDEAVREAKELMLASRNILGPKDGEPIINPGQDIILGLYYLTQEATDDKVIGEGRYFGSYDEMMTAYENKLVSLHARVVLPISEINKRVIPADGQDRYIVSTVGKFIFNSIFPDSFEFIFGKYVERNIKEVDGKKVISEKEVLHTSGDKNQLKNYLLPYGMNFPEIIKNMPLNLPLGKKDIAKIVRRIFDRYVAIVTMEDLAAIISDLNSETINNLFDNCANLVDYNKNTIPVWHTENLVRIIKEEYEKINEELMIEYRKVDQEIGWRVSDYTKMLERVWFRYTNFVADVLDKLKALGYHYSTISGTTISISDVTTLPSTKDKIKEGDKYIEQLRDYFEQGLLTDDERYALTIQKWAEIKDSIEKDLKEVTKTDPDNPLFMMFTSGARGNSSNFVQLAGMRGLMNNNTKILKADAENERVVRSTVEIPVKSSFLDGLTAYEFYSSTHGARKGLTDTALNTAKSGYLTRRLVDVAQGIVVREDDCGTDYGFEVKDILDTKTNTIIESLGERIEGRFSNVPIYHPRTKEMILDADQLITPQIAEEIVKAGIKSVEIRSVLSCYTKNGVCKKCYGKDLALNRVVNIGEAVGVVAAQSIGEPGTQLTMRTFHTGGVAGVEDITGGFGRLMELIDAYDSPWGKPAVIAEHYGKITKIEDKKDTLGNASDYQAITLEYEDEEGNTQSKIYAARKDRRLRVKKGDKVIPGQKIVEGPIILNELLKVADTRSVQNYLLKEVQRLYRLQGITISDKYIEIIIRQMLSKIVITDPGDSKFFSGNLVDIFAYQRESARLISQGKKPPFGEVKIKGAKQTPLLSDSFLAAASYQETPKILVNASIAAQSDKLEGLKENIILGHKIPAGTNCNFEEKGKYDIRDPRSYFQSKFAENSDFPNPNFEDNLNNLQSQLDEFNSVDPEELAIEEEMGIEEVYEDDYYSDLDENNDNN
ncbi:DNA-directed RNA polymerase subunit beta' [Mycoplasmopsis fermentans]|uniref:DNA-directed RNA polymerase subunit beta' n=1 Tax=Mycoplasmopsis fermentans (strain M64) TaxID=943945 RepID=A0AB32XB60_MYCFM|nr:DNA-directed RNA polymerase subunit beta' [Mycoplasmopsis fermentans]ADN68868.1 DNA-directed RNA polymerase beta' chain [Mycoplasmopsis fermentans JER]ADV34310.1 DNA-directed RNA polymerase subunit beta [Mycoplasmopsis fermentans M64]RMX35799.1 DNA-directed RNA polymerase, beta' subunit [Mycoplasmopsis fermentans MF-I2]